MKRKNRKERMAITAMAALLCLCPFVGKVETNAEVAVEDAAALYEFSGEGLLQEEAEEEVLQPEGAGEERVQPEGVGEEGIQPEGVGEEGIQSEGAGTIVASGKNGDLDWSVDASGVLRISGSGEFDPRTAWDRRGKKVIVSVSNITSLEKMFKDSIIESVDFTESDLSKVRSIRELFYGCDRLKTVNMSGAELGNVQDLIDVFYDCCHLQKIDWSKVTLSSGYGAWGYKTFYHCYDLKEIKCPKRMESTPLPYASSYHWTDEGGNDVTVMSTSEKEMTYKRGAQYNVGEEHKSGSVIWSIDENGTLTLKGSGRYLDDGAENEYRMPIPAWTDLADQIRYAVVEIEQCTRADGMFDQCHKLQSVDLSKFDMSRITNINNMFRDCESLQSIDFSGKDLSKVTQMAGLFDDCKCLRSIDFSKVKTGKVTYMHSTFNDCTHLQKLDLSGIDGSTVTNAYALFAGCEDLKELDLSFLRGCKLETCKYMFQDCFRLKNLDLSPLDTSRSDDFICLFRGCADLTELDLSGLNVEMLRSAEYMLQDCTSLKKIIMPAGLKADIQLPELKKKYAWKCEDGKICTKAVMGAQRAFTYSRVNRDGSVDEDEKTDAQKEKESGTTKAAKKGTIITDGKNLYEVIQTLPKEPQVIYKKNTDKKVKKVKVKESIKWNGVTYQVTGIGKNAFKNKRNLKKVTLPKTIGSIGKNAFKGINKKAVIKVPAKRKKKFKKMLKKAGLPSSVTIK